MKPPTLPKRLDSLVLPAADVEVATADWYWQWDALSQTWCCWAGQDRWRYRWIRGATPDYQRRDYTHNGF